MSLRVIAGILLLAASVGVAGERARVRRFEADARWRVVRPLPPRTLRVDEVAAWMATTTRIPFLDYDRDYDPENPHRVPADGVVLHVQGSLQPRRVSIGNRDASAGELMEALEVALAAQWSRVHKRWVLVDVPELAPVACLSMLELSMLQGPQDDAMSILTEDQARTLASGRPLLVRALGARQRAALAHHAQRCYVGRPNIAREALDLDGAFLWLRAARPDERVSGEVQFYLPTNDGSLYESVVSIPVDGLRVVPDPLGGGRVAPAMGPLVPRRYSDIPPPPAADLMADERLNPDLSGQPVNVTAAVKLLAEAGKLSVVVSTRLADRKVHLPRPGAGETPTVRRWMELVSAETGGYWTRAGRAYALAPHPRVERAAAIEDWLRPRNLTGGCEQFARSLSPSQRRKLRERRLAADDLTRMQEPVLRWVAALAFVIDPQVARAALDLKGVTVGLAPPRAAGETRMLECWMPARTGPERLVAAVPLT